MVLKKNHDRLDAVKAMKSLIQVYVTRYTRRIEDLGFQILEESLLQLAREGKEVKDAIAIGEAAADRAAMEFLGTGRVEQTIEIGEINALQVKVGSAPENSDGAAG